MNKVSFRDLPLVAKVAIGIAFNNAWWSIEEFVIDRSNVWRYMPDYRVGKVCIWDVTVALLTVIGLWWLSRPREGRRVAGDLRVST
jgi:hypothetical protein